MGCEELVVYVFGWGWRSWRGGGGERMRGLDLGFTNPVGTGGVCVLVAVVWVGGLDLGLERWGVVMSGLSV